MKNSLVVLWCLLIGQSVFAQKYTFQQVLDSALTHPFIQAGEKAIDAQQALTKSSFNLAPTNVTYSYGALNEVGIGDYALSINQSFYLPKYYKRQEQLLNANVDVQKAQFLALKNDFIKDVKTSYYQLAFEQASLLRYEKLDSLYHQMETVIQKQLELGEIDFTIQANFVLESQQIHLEVHQKELDVNVALANLHEYLPSSFDTIQATKLEIAELTQSSVENNPTLQLASTEAMKQEKAIEVSKNELAVNWNIGYVNKKLEGQIVSEYNVGVDIPLWRKAPKAQVQAQRLQYENALIQKEATNLHLQAQAERVYQEYLKNKESIEFYENKAIPMMEKLITLSQNKYQQGDIDFLTYAQNIQKSIQIELNHLSAILAFNQSVVELEYLSGDLTNIKK